MTNNEFISKLLLMPVNIDCGSIDIYCKATEEGECKPASCEINTIGLQELDINALVQVLESPELANVSKLLLNRMYGKAIYDTTDSVKTTDEWTEVPIKIISSYFKIGNVLEEATVHGLDFKYENGKYYYKERQAVPN